MQSMSRDSTSAGAVMHYATYGNTGREVSPRWSFLVKRIMPSDAEEAQVEGPGGGIGIWDGQGGGNGGVCEQTNVLGLFE